MAYTLDFTATIHARFRARVRWGLFALGVVLAATGWGVRWTWQAWYQPTLAERLSQYHPRALMLENLQAKWLEANQAYEAILPWYRLYWGENAAAALSSLLPRASRLPEELVPTIWELKTGGECRLTFQLQFHKSDKLNQLLVARAQLQGMVSPPWKGAVNWKEEDLGGVDRKEISLVFTLAGVDRVSPAPPADLNAAVDFIVKRRTTISGHRFNGRDGVARTMAGMLDEAFLATATQLQLAAPEREAWKTQVERAVDPAAVLREMEAAFSARQQPVPEPITAALEEWTHLATRRWPWQRIRTLEGPDLLAEMNQLEALNNSGLPPARLFAQWTERCQSHRQALAGGLSETDVFHENKALELAAPIFSDWSEDDWEFKPTRDLPLDGLMFVRWTLEVGAADQSKQKINKEPRDFSERLLKLLNLNAGFVMESVRLEFDSAGTSLVHAQVEGRLAVPVDTAQPAFSGL